MSAKVSDFIVQRLAEWGVERIFGYSGDGAMQMIGLNVLLTIGQRWRRWNDPRLVVPMLNNRELAYVTWEQRVLEGDPKFPPSQDILDPLHAKIAELMGLKGIRERRLGALQRYKATMAGGSSIR